MGGAAGRRATRRTVRGASKAEPPGFRAARPASCGSAGHREHRLAARSGGDQDELSPAPPLAAAKRTFLAMGRGGRKLWARKVHSTSDYSRVSPRANARLARQRRWLPWVHRRRHAERLRPCDRSPAPHFRPRDRCRAPHHPASSRGRLGSRCSTRRQKRSPCLSQCHRASQAGCRS